MSSTNIQSIFNLIKLSLAFMGTNVFVDFKDLNIFSKLYRILTFINTVFFYLMGFFYTFLYNIQNPDKDKFGEQLLLFNCICGVITTAIRIYLSFYLKDKYFAVFEWILNVHEQPQDQTLQSYVGTKFEDLGIQSLKNWRRWTKIVLSVLMFSIASNYYQAIVDPTFELVFPSHVPYVSKESRFYFGLNFWTQMLGYFSNVGFLLIDFLILVTITSHILTEMDVINEMCRDVGKYEADCLDKLEGEDVDGVETIHLAGEMEAPKADILLKLILERHCKVIETIQNASDFYIVTTLFYESLAFTNFLFIYYLLFIFGGFYNLILGTLMLAPQYFVVSLIGTNILEKGNLMTKALYESHWLHLKPKDRKVLCMIMAMSQKSHTLSAGGFGNVVLARFALVMSFSYRCCLLVSFFLGKSA